ncbi:uncharacterized protein BKA55DRAFT_736492 [Fusarium redolens]|uniref:Phosphoglycerate mutase family protein n=1 Tax=Fusarium redolens TaxID=48865 RepID=A0A9P9HDT5_FUSRE|nr:uncharacterized protein BKA55DRAFT_736492 [Fusarium redolens]KAH7255068.1 hypothetical protein BKA55DRAFT_736492 [Fusarium redolens]
MPHEQSTEPTIFLIRHGEKPPKVGGKDQEGLSAQGKIRALELRMVFGKESAYDIGYIMAEEPHRESHLRPYDTMEPLAKELNLKVHDSVQRDQYDKVARKALSFKGPGNVLICWEHHALAGIAKAIGVQGYAAATGWTGEVEYPDSMFDLIWVVPPPYTEITEVRSEKVPVLDDSVQTNASGDVLPTLASEGN